MKFYIFLLCFCCVQVLNAQTKLPIIKATSPKVAIRDDGFLDKNAWSLDPKARPDVYTAERSRKAKWVIFYTDIDSIKVKLKATEKLDFIILLNGKDSCFTQIASAMPIEKRENTLPNTHDTIPFALSPTRAIHVKAVLNNQDTLNLHFDVSSYDFRLKEDAILKRTHLLANQRFTTSWTPTIAMN